MAAVTGKYLFSRSVPAAESVPAGALTWPPNPALWYPATAADSAPNTITPTDSAMAGRRTIRVAIRPHRPVVSAPGLCFDGQNAARPKIASSAGSRVRPASSITPMPMASGMPRLE